MPFLSKQRGFTLVELIVSISIMVIISTVIASGQSRYTSGASLKNVANELGLSLRQAQVYGISVKELGTGSETFNVGYGVSFNLSAMPSGDSGAYIFFADKNGNGRYGDTWNCPISGSSECLDKISLRTGNSVSKLCTINASQQETCSGINSLDITFIRPAIEANIYYNGGSTAATGARIELTSLDGKINSITIYRTGQISVQ